MFTVVIVFVGGELVDGETLLHSQLDALRQNLYVYIYMYIDELQLICNMSELYVCIYIYIHTDTYTVMINNYIKYIKYIYIHTKLSKIQHVTFHLPYPSY